MTFYDLCKQIVIFSTIICLFFLTFCKKEEEGNQKPYRLVERRYYESNILTISNYCQYDSNRLSIKRDFYHYEGGIDSLKGMITYPDENNIEIERLFNFGGVYYPIDKYIMENDDGQLVHVEIRGFDGSYWQPIAKYDYIYSGQTLMEEKWEYYTHGEWIPDLKILYDYTGTQVKRATYYDYSEEWTLSGKEEASYQGTDLSEIISYLFSDSVMKADQKFVYHYAGDVLKGLGIYEFDGYNWDTAGAITLDFDSHQNLVSESYKNGIDEIRIEYDYEEGEGNYRQFILPGGGLLYFKPYPTPTKGMELFGRPSESLISSHFRLFTN